MRPRVHHVYVSDTELTATLGDPGASDSVEVTVRNPSSEKESNTVASLDGPRRCAPGTSESRRLGRARLQVSHNPNPGGKGPKVTQQRQQGSDHRQDDVAAGSTQPWYLNKGSNKSSFVKGAKNPQRQQASLMSDFGDFDEDDAFDNEPADPEQVAIKIHRLRRERGLEGPAWEARTEEERAVLVAIAGRLLAWMRRQGALLMTGLYYTDMLDVLLNAGCQVAENATTDGWEHRARSVRRVPQPAARRRGGITPPARQPRPTTWRG